jgi:hypothetical protein
VAPVISGCTSFPADRLFANLVDNQKGQNFRVDCESDLCVPFAPDIELDQCANQDGSVSTYTPWRNSISIGNGGALITEFEITAYSAGSPGHSSVLGPRTADCTDFPSLRLNLHYDHSMPEVSVSSSSGAGVRYQIGAGHYLAVIHNRDFQWAKLDLIQDNVPVFSDSVRYNWPPFDAYQMCYDYYGGGYCQWDSIAGAVAFRSDRGSHYIEGLVRQFCVHQELYGADVPNPAPISANLTLRWNAEASVTRITTLLYSLPKEAEVEIWIYDITGRLVDRVPPRREGPGTHQVVWLGKTSGGRGVPSGVYIARARALGEVATAKFVRW